MYKVLVADDEPMALQMMIKIVTDRCPEFEICDTAADGKEALDKIRKEKPDVVITDIKMPLVSGVRICELIREENPDVFFIIISGYQSFEYAQRAIRSGAADYILKPIVPSVLQKAMAKLAEKIRVAYYYRRNRLLRQICNGSDYDLDEMRMIFPYESLYVGFVRQNGLPRRFTKNVGREIYSDIDEQYMIYGRDEMEALYLIPTEMLGTQSIKSYMQKVADRQKKANTYQTIIYSEKRVQVENLTEVIRLIYDALAHYTVIGKNQTIAIDQKNADLLGHRNGDDKQAADEDSFADMELLISDHKIDQAKRKIQEAFHRWQSQDRPQGWMEYAARNLNNLCIRYQHIQDNAEIINREILLDDAFYEAANVEELTEAVLGILFQNEETEKNVTKLDSPEFLKEVLEYLHHHLKDPLSMSEVCRTFGVSQTYLSKIFRKYTGLSFNQKVTELRMEKAKRIIQENSEYFIKEIAEMVGYQDQFYFSRVFRSYVGKSPSEYADELEKYEELD
ncbi:MAG: response regulator [Eubacterium sp.]|nr:response regulator [Eubacterium sp.]